MEGALDSSDAPAGRASEQSFNEKELDKIIRQIVDKVRGNYFEHGETARGIPGEVKRIIEQNIDRV